MASSSNQLYTFAISHNCEKARWALDWHRIPFQEVGWPPGLHMRLLVACDSAQAREIEQRADRTLGVHVRRLFYAEVLPHQSHRVKPWLMANTSPAHRSAT